MPVMRHVYNCVDSLCIGCEVGQAHAKPGVDFS